MEVSMVREQKLCVLCVCVCVRVCVCVCVCVCFCVCAAEAMNVVGTHTEEEDDACPFSPGTLKYYGRAELKTSDHRCYSPHNPRIHTHTHTHTHTIVYTYTSLTHHS